MKIIKYVFSRIKENIEIIKCGGRNNYILKTLRDGGAFIGERFNYIPRTYLLIQPDHGCSILEAIQR